MQYFNREFHSSTTCWFNDTPCHTYGTYCSNNEKLTIIALYIFGSRMNMSNQITYLIKLLSLTSHVNFRFHQNNLIYKITKAPKYEYAEYFYISHQVYSDITQIGEGWTLIVRFSNNDVINWMSETGHRWYDQHVGIGATTSTNEKCWHDLTAFCSVSGRNFKITHSNDPQSHSQWTAWPDKHSDLKSQVMGTVEIVQSLKALWTNIHGLHSNKTPGARLFMKYSWTSSCSALKNKKMRFKNRFLSSRYSRVRKNEVIDTIWVVLKGAGFVNWRYFENEQQDRC